jgi:hypothetical protein
MDGQVHGRIAVDPHTEMASRSADGSPTRFHGFRSAMGQRGSLAFDELVEHRVTVQPPMNRARS